jgi:hypothetical protein
MFYKKEDIDSALICLYCDNNLRDPRILPCGASACHECIQSRIDTNSQELECLICHKKHVPQNKEEGFFPNLALLKIIESKSSEVNRGQRVDIFKLKLVEIKKLGDEFKVSLDTGADEIKEYCIQLRNQVQLETEILIEQIHQFNTSLVADIDNYEKECVRSFSDKISEKEKKFREFQAETSTFYDETSNYLNEFIIDYEKIESSIHLANDYLQKLKKEKDALHALKFQSRLMEFNKNKIEKSTILLGSFGFQELCKNCDIVINPPVTVIGLASFGHGYQFWDESINF